jgi:hypothetical protein
VPGLLLLLPARIGQSAGCWPRPTDYDPVAPSIGVADLGHVGLPLAIALARHFPMTGIDINAERVDELRD